VLACHRLIADTVGRLIISANMPKMRLVSCKRYRTTRHITTSYAM